jgi:hypothetical protein
MENVMASLRDSPSPSQIGTGFSQLPSSPLPYIEDPEKINKKWLEVVANISYVALPLSGFDGGGVLLSGGVC